MQNIYIENEAKKGFENWTKEGWEFLLQNSEYKEVAIISLSSILDLYQRVEFKSNSLYYEIFTSSASSEYVVNVYSNANKNDEGNYLEENIVDGGICTGNARDAVEFLL